MSLMTLFSEGLRQGSCFCKFCGRKFRPQIRKLPFADLKHVITPKGFKAIAQHHHIRIQPLKRFVIIDQGLAHEFTNGCGGIARQKHFNGFIRLKSVSPNFLSGHANTGDRCMPVATICKVRFGASWTPCTTHRSSPYSARVPVKMQIFLIFSSFLSCA